MNLNEALKLLREHNYLVESEKLNNYDKERLGRNYQNNRQFHTSLSMEDPDSEELKTYLDNKGKKWIYVNKKDRLTILSAFMDGMCDATDGYVDDLIDRYHEVKTKEDLLKLWDEEFIYDNEGEDLHEKFDTLYSFLKKYMKGRTTVYRGLRISKSEFSKLTQDPKNMLGKYLLKYYSNTTKPFNSFTTDMKVALRYSMQPLMTLGVDFNNPDDYYSIVISAEAEPNDINFAFTAYLYGYFDNKVEVNSELNINNIKELSNFKIEKYIKPGNINNDEYEKSSTINRQNISDYEIEDEFNNDIITSLGENPERYKVVIKNNYYNIFDLKTNKLVYKEWFKRLHYDLGKEPFTVISKNNKYNYITKHFRLIFDTWLDEPLKYNPDVDYNPNPAYYFEVVIDGKHYKLDRNYKVINL